MTTRQKVLVFVLAGLSGVGGIAVMGWFIVQQTKSVLRPAPLTAADKRLVLTAADLVPFGGPEVDPKAEHLTSLRQIDGSKHIQYEYEIEPRDTDGTMRRLYLQSITFVQPHSLGARQMYKMQKLGIKAGMKFAGGEAIGLADAPNLLTGGDERYAAYVIGGGKRIGNLFMIREGRVVHSVMLVGLYFEKPDDVQELLEPMLAESRRRAR